MRISKKKIISIMLLSLLTIVIAYMLPIAFYATVSGLNAYSPDMLDSFITVEIQHPDGTTDSYQSNSFPVVNRGDVLTARIPLPDQMDIKDPVFCFHVYQSVLTLYCGDRVIYSYGRQIADAGHMIGGIYTSAVLPPDAAGQVLTLCCEVQEQHAFSSLYNFTLLPATESAHACLLGHMSDFIFFLSMSFFSTLAMILMSIFLVISRDWKKYRQSFLLAVLCNSICGYLMAYYALYNIICPNVQVGANLEYIMAFLLPVPFTAYYCATASKPVTRRIMNLQTILFSCFFLICTILNYFTSDWHYCVFINANIVLILISCTVTAFLYLYYEKVNLPSLRDNLNRYTQIIFLFVVITTFLSFVLNRYLNTMKSFLASYIIPISYIYLMFMLILSFLIDLYDSYRKQLEARRLECLAYTDCLTGLANRSVFEREMNDLKGHPAEPFSLIYFDLNHLKLANDRYGHDMGDHYLKKAAEFIDSSCPEASAVCRIGGDEFVAIFRKNNVSKAEIAIHELECLTADVNGSGVFPFRFSISCGMAQSTAKYPLTPDEALKKADSEMYLSKKRTYLSAQHD
ncbi:MAG: GGDEF domain-containing protein [Butyrivibrio sp.]|nr:GGDEF domain-containing protein [Butyrivibrio sp.]